VIVSVERHRIWVRDFQSGELVLGPLTGPDSARAVAVGTWRGRAVIVSTFWRGNTVLVWDLEQDEPVPDRLAWHDHRGLVLAVGTLHGRPVIVSGGGTHGTVRVWNLESGRPVLGPLGHDSEVNAVTVAERHGRPVIVSACQDGTARVWDLESDRDAALLIDLQHRAHAVASMANRLVIGTEGELLQIDLL